LTNLSTLFLDRNQLSGSVPDDICLNTGYIYIRADSSVCNNIATTVGCCDEIFP